MEAGGHPPAPKAPEVGQTSTRVLPPGDLHPEAMLGPLQERGKCQVLGGQVGKEGDFLGALGSAQRPPLRAGLVGGGVWGRHQLVVHHVALNLQPHPGPPQPGWPHASPSAGCRPRGAPGWPPAGPSARSQTPHRTAFWGLSLGCAPSRTINTDTGQLGGHGVNFTVPVCWTAGFFSTVHLTTRQHRPGNR